MKLTLPEDTKVLGYDLGGTKIRVGLFNAKGELLEQALEPTQSEDGKDAVIERIAKLADRFTEKHPEIKAIGLAAAGPLHPEKGVLLNPTNLLTDGKTWGEVPITKLLSEKTNLPVFLENDAAAAVLAEHWQGVAQGINNVMVLTLGTGLGVGIICNGKLVRSGQGLHPEAGHITLRYGDPHTSLNTGLSGSAEAYLSGTHFASRTSEVYFNGETHSAREIAELARKKDKRALKAFQEYSELMAVAIRNYALLYAPEVLVLTGSFANASDVFLKDTEKLLGQFLENRRIGVDMMPQLRLSSLENQAGIIGAAFVALGRI
jgi:glucokinase